MKISRVLVHLLKKELKSTMDISRGGFNSRTHCLVEVFTDEGITGLGEGVGNAQLIQGILENYLCQHAIGLDPTDINNLRNKLLDTHVYYERKGSAICAFSAIEMACWDIKAKSKGLPLYALLGGLAHPKLECYVSDIYWDSPTEMAKVSRRIYDMGFRNFKIHIGRMNPEDECARIAAVREVIGDSNRLMIDINAGYSLEQSLKAVKLWQDFKPFWIEEPLAPDQLKEFAQLRKCSEIPIAAGENEFRVSGFGELFDHDTIDVAMPDLGRCGGIQEAKFICELAKNRNIKVSPHNFSSGVLLSATMHLMAATQNTELLEYDSSCNSIYHELLVEPLEIANSLISIPKAPGLGVEISSKLRKDQGLDS